MNLLERELLCEVRVPERTVRKWRRLVIDSFPRACFAAAHLILAKAAWNKVLICSQKVPRTDDFQVNNVKAALSIFGPTI